LHFVIKITLVGAAHCRPFTITAYQRLKSSVSEKELNEIYTPTADEFELAHSLTHSAAMRIGFLVLLKTFQRLGYFIPAHNAPRPIAERISVINGVHYQAMEWEALVARIERFTVRMAWRAKRKRATNLMRALFHGKLSSDVR